MEGGIGGGGENGRHNQPVPPTFAARSRLFEVQANQAEQGLEAISKRYENRNVMLSRLCWEIHSSQHGVNVKHDLSHSVPVSDGLTIHLDASDLNAKGILHRDEPNAPTEVIETWTDVARGQMALAHSTPKRP